MGQDLAVTECCHNLAGRECWCLPVHKPSASVLCRPQPTRQPRVCTVSTLAMWWVWISWPRWQVVRAVKLSPLCVLL
jgi:hypothetical protein